MSMIDFVVSFANPFSPLVREAPGGIKKWWFARSWNVLEMQNAKCRTMAFRLVGITVGFNAVTHKKL